MSWGTDFTADIYIRSKGYHILYDVEDEIEERKKTIQHFRECILMQCAMGAPKECKDVEGNPINPIDEVHAVVNQWLDCLIEENDRLYELYLLRDDWDEKEKKFKSASVG